MRRAIASLAFREVSTDKLAHYLPRRKARRYEAVLHA